MNCKSALNSNISVAKYLSTIVIDIILLQFFLENSENDSKLKDRINRGIYSKIYFRILGLDLGLDTSSLFNIHVAQ